MTAAKVFRSAKTYLAVLWVILGIFAAYKWSQSPLTLKETPEWMSQKLLDFGLAKAAAIYIILYTLRPLVFFPATLFTVASGMVFGPTLGIVFTVIGENLSANFAFFLARFFGRSWVKEHETETMEKWQKRLEENGLITVMVMRFIYLPFDLTNYGCGLTAIKFRDYAIGTFVGIFPAIIAFVSLGASVSATGKDRLVTAILFVVFALIGVVIAKYLKRRETTIVSDE